jgi:hypothetical protein
MNQSTLNIGDPIIVSLPGQPEFAAHIIDIWSAQDGTLNYVVREDLTNDVLTVQLHEFRATS